MKAVALAGGVGGAKLAHGLQAMLGADLTVVVNTGDDFERHGLLVCADHDTVMYTLADIANSEWGWGIQGETWNAADQLGRYGEETWFRLGDRDLATHVVRTARRRTGQRLTEIAGHLQRSLGVRSAILPMSDDDVRTHVRTDDGWLEFQEYFVHRHQEPVVHEVAFRGIETARPSPDVLAALAAADVIVIAPSNPIVSIGPILAVPGMQTAIGEARRRGAPVVAVSPIISGRALKGPADRMLVSLGHESSAAGVAALYRELVDIFVFDDTDDAGQGRTIAALGMRAVQAPTIMTGDESKAALARVLLALAADAARGARGG